MSPVGPAQPPPPPPARSCLRSSPASLPEGLSSPEPAVPLPGPVPHPRLPHGWVGHVLAAGTETLTDIHLRADSKSKRLLGKTLRLSRVRAQRSFPGSYNVSFKCHVRCSAAAALGVGRDSAARLQSPAWGAWDLGVVLRGQGQPSPGGRH